MSRITGLGLALAAFAVGCGRDVMGPQTRYTLEALSPTSFVGTVGSVAQHEPIVRALDRAGRPVVGAAVVFTAHAPNGETVTALKAIEVVTDGEGVARAGEWTLATIAGANLMQATLYGAPQLWFTAHGVPDTPVALRWVEERQGEIGFAGMAVQPPNVILIDRFGNGVPEIAVSFAITAGGGALEGPEAVTDDHGAAVASWTLGELGANTIRASALDLPSIEFTIEVVEATAIYDLTMINGESIEESGVVSAFIGLTSDGRFVSQIYSSHFGSESLRSESGTYTLSGSELSLTYHSFRGREVGTLANGMLVLDRWEDEFGHPQQWSYEIRN